MFLYNYIIHPIEFFYKFIYLLLADWFGNYGIAVIALSLLSFVLLYPFSRKAHQLQQEEQHLQEILQGQIQSIKSTFSGAEQFEKIQRLYDRYSYHPIMAIRSVMGLLIQLPFLLAAFYMLSNCAEIKGVAWEIIPDLGRPDALLNGINVMPFVMTIVSVAYAFAIPTFSYKQKLQTIGISVLFLLLLYNAPSALLIFWTCNLVWSLLDSVLSKKLEWLGEFISENELAFHVILALSLTVGLLVPTEVYIKNASELWFEYKDILKYFIADTAKYFVVLFLVYLLCRQQKKRMFYLSVLLGLLFGVFLQSYIISINYGLFDGHEIEWEKYTKIGLLNTFIWAFCLIETFIKFKRFQHNSERMKKIIKPIAFGIVVIQCFVLLMNLRDNPIQKDILFEEGKVGVLTTKDLYTVSEKDNIIIFLLDTFDAEVFEEILQKNPDVAAEFKDFTYYPDTISSFGFTHFSLPEILTGNLYIPTDKYSDYLYSAWKKNYYYDRLQQKGYSIDLYTSGNYVDKNASINNMVSEKVSLSADSANIFNNVAKFRMAPHYLKQVFYQYQPSIFNPSLINGNVKAYGENDRDFYLGLKNGLNKSKSNVFKFYHLVGMHHPYILNEDVEYLKFGEKGTAYKQALGSLKIVSEYIRQLKINDLYANATFVVLADHGFHNTIGTRPLLLIKSPKSNNEKLIVSKRPTMVAELMTLLFHDVIDDLSKANIVTSQKQRIYHLERDGKFIRYLVQSPASDVNSWIELGEISRQYTAYRKYYVGDTIDFTERGNANNFKTFGWSDLVWTGSMITEHKAEIILEINSKKAITSSSLNIEIECHPLLEYFGVNNRVDFRDMKLYANDTLLGSWRLNDANLAELACKLPVSVLSQNRTAFHFVIDNPDGITQPVRFLIRTFKISEK